MLKYGFFLVFFVRQPNTPTWILAEFANIDLEELTTYAEQEYPKCPIMNQVEGWIGDRCGGLIELTKSNDQIISPTLRGLSRIYNPHTDDLPSLCLQDRTYCQISFWDRGYSYEFGKTPTNDWIGTKFESEFEYNP